MDIKPPPICVVNKKYLKKQRYKENKRVKQLALVGPTVAELKDRLHHKLAHNQEAMKKLTNAINGEQMVELDTLFKQMGVNDTLTQNQVRQLLKQISQ